MTIWTPDKTNLRGPIYLAIADAIEDAVAKGELPPGSKLPPQRELAYRLGITLSTVTRAYSEAERRKLVYGETGRGTFVSPNRSVPASPLMPMEHSESIYDLARNFALPHLNPDLGTALRALASDTAVNQLNTYVPSEGLLRHREAGARFLNQYYAISADPDRVAVTCGAQHGIHVLLLALFNPGDAIAVDELTYPSLVSFMPLLNLKVISVALGKDDQGNLTGMDPDALEEACKVHHVRGVFLIPNVHNPTTHTMTISEREAVAEVAARYRLRIIEDDPYTPFLTSMPASFASLLPERTASIGSPSKAMAPGLRTGFVHVPEAWYSRVRHCIGGSVWMASPLTTEIVCRWITDDTIEKTIQNKRKVTATRFEEACKILRPYNLQGGPEKQFLWVRLPDDLIPAMIEADLARKRVEILGSHHFQAHGQFNHPALRLTLGTIASDNQFLQALKLVRSSLDSISPAGSYSELTG